MLLFQRCSVVASLWELMLVFNESIILLLSCDFCHNFLLFCKKYVIEVAYYSETLCWATTE